MKLYTDSIHKIAYSTDASAYREIPMGVAYPECKEDLRKLILLAKDIANDERRHFATLPIRVKRNAYGRQRESFYAESDFGDCKGVPMEFIRAPYIEAADDDVKIMSVVDGNIVGVKYGNQIAVSFHPELCEDTRIHEYFLGLCN